MNKGQEQPCNRGRKTKGQKTYGKKVNFTSNQRNTNKMRLF